MKRARIIRGDCRRGLLLLEDESIDAIVTDPPYGLGFMGKGWDHGVPGVEFWRAFYRVLKPGGYLLAFGGTRTYHRIAVAIEDAGFEIRDTLMWMYGQGFPKSLDVSKAIDRAAGAEREVVGYDASRARPNRLYDSGAIGNIGTGRGNPIDRTDNGATITAPATDEARRWDGWGTALKPAWEPVILARKPFTGTVAQNVLAHGTGALNIDATRIGYQDEADKALATPQGRVTSKEVSAIGAEPDAGRELERVEFERPEQKGRFPANVILAHHEDCVRVGERRVKAITGGYTEGSTGTMGAREGRYGAAKGEAVRDRTTAGTVDSDGMETVEAWECVEDCPVRLLDEQAGDRPVARTPSKAVGSESIFRPGQGGYQRQGVLHQDSGGASRFFYCAKAAKSERNAGIPKVLKPPWMQKPGKPPIYFSNEHPTVKPVEIMRWLVRLVTPPGGTVLDPFMGSGTTGVACAAEGFTFIGMDKDEHGSPDDTSYISIAGYRLVHAGLEPWIEDAPNPVDEVADRHVTPEPIPAARMGDASPQPIRQVVEEDQSAEPPAPPKADLAALAAQAMAKVHNPPTPLPPTPPPRVPGVATEPFEDGVLNLD